MYVCLMLCDRNTFSLPLAFNRRVLARPRAQGLKYISQPLMFFKCYNAVH